MELNDFTKDFMETARAIAVTEGDFEEAAFVSEAARRLVEAEELEDFEPCHFEGTGSRQRRLRVDGYCFDDVDGSVSLVVANYDGSDSDLTLTQTDATKYFSMLRAFAEDSLSGRLQNSLEESSPGYGLACDLYYKRETISRFRAFLLSNAILSSRVKDWPEDALAGKPVEFHIWDIARFHRVFESAVGRDELEVDFTEFKEKGLLCLEANQPKSDYKAYLAVIPANILVDIYERFGSRLLEGNVRSFLSTRPKVNKNIRISILNEPEMFFAYNNGIAATATEVTIAQGRLQHATHLQIVNGGQTTASLALARRKDKAELDRIFVPMKLSVVTPATAETVIPQISYCANSQNKVSDADFFSNHPFHVRIEEISRRIWAPATGGSQLETHWFYERARGQYLNEQVKLSKSEQKRFLIQNPRHQVLTKTDLAKYENSWKGLPHIVSRGAQKNFLSFAGWIGEEWKRSEADFNEEFFRSSIAKAIIFRHVERLITHQPWYQHGYRANIVAYSIAKLTSLIKANAPGMTLDLKRIWTSQSVSSDLHEQLTLIAKSAFDVIVSPDLGVQNVTEWCKKEVCWQRLRESDTRLMKGFFQELIEEGEVQLAKKDARAQQHISSGIEAQTKVVNLGGPYWSRLATWGKQRNLLSASDEKLLRVAAKIPKTIPEDWQSVALLEILQRMEDEGYRG
jgi:hypothetical protein